MATIAPATATCITCSHVFYRLERDEDGAPEIPGQKCAIPECETWICEAGCSDHHSLHCECGRRVCQEHIVQRAGFGVLCRACADELTCLDGCGNCGATTEGWQSGLCNECREEDNRIERLAAELASVPSCESRQRIIERAQSAAEVVNGLRAHDMSGCGLCRALTQASETRRTAQGEQR